jgi:membrane protein
VLTRARIERWSLLVGSLATSALLSVGTTLVGLYLANFGGRSLSGAATGVFLALTWLYYVSQIVLVGLHLTRVLHERRTSASGDPAHAGSV